MENIHSLPKRSFSSNPNAGFTSHKSVYDDVFGGPPKFGLPTLAPRLEDYSEIFGGFHSSRSSSIPVLDLPLIGHESDLHFDVRSSSFDYNEVFGDFGSLDFTASFEDLFGQSSGGGYDSSDEPWSPAQSGSLSDELDPLAGSDNIHRLSDGDMHQSSQSIKQLNASYNKSSQRSVQTVVAAAHHVTNFNAVPGCTFSHYESPVSWDGEDEHCSIGTIDDSNHNKEFAERVREENPSKCSSSSLHSGSETHRSDQNPLEKHENSTSPRDKPFVTVSDISLRTKPSRLPPPSRPPPVLAVQKEGGRSNSKLKVSKSYAFERVADVGAPLFFDEINAAISAEDRENRNKNLKVTDQSTTEPVERKFIRSYSAMQVDEKTNKSGRLSSPVEDEELLQSHGKETTEREAVVEERIETTKRTEATSGSSGVQCSNRTSENSDKAVAWTEATEYFEVVEENISRQPFDVVKDVSWIQHMNRDAHVQQEKTECQTSNLKEDCKEFKVTTEAHRWQEKNQPAMNREHYECGKKQQKEIPNTRMSDRKGSPDKTISNKLTCAYNVNKKIPENLLGEFEGLQIDHSDASDVQPEAKGNMDEVAAKLKLKGSPKIMNIEKRSVVPQITKQKSGKHKHNVPTEEFQRRLEDVEGTEINREIVKERKEAEGTEKQHWISEKQNENKLDETCELKEDAGILKEGKMHKESGEKSYVAARHDIGGDENLAHGKDMDAGELMVNELAFREALKQVGNDKEHKSIHERDVFKERNGDAPKTGDNFLRSRLVETGVGGKDQAFETTGNMSFSGDAGLQGHLRMHAEELKPIESNGNGRGLERDVDGHVTIEGDQLKVFEGGYKVDEMFIAKVLGKHDTVQTPEETQATCSSDGKWELKTEPKGSICESEIGMNDTLAEGRFGESGKNKDELQDRNILHASNKTVEAPCLPKQMSDSNICGIDVGISHGMPSALEYTHEPAKIMLNEDGVQKMNKAHFVSKRIDLKDNFNPSQERREFVINGRKVEDASSLLKHDNALFSVKNATSQRIDRKDLYMKENFAAKDQKVGERIRRETTEENERLRKLEEEREREREREKDRMAVDRAALEAREGSYSEGHERADKERAAVERATAEARQRAMAEACERLEKASIEARLRAQRAAVERATAEARQRAAEKLIAQKAAYDPNYQVERSIPDRFSASSRFADTRQGYVSSEFSYQSTGTSNGLRSYSLAHEGDSPQRCKARYERYRRTAERAANALAEKNRRDLLAQREREERNRVAEALDAEVKRWSSGKEGNLRALLSTLQYILGPDSGWHPIPLTEVITSAAVKRAYRKATLCVHPDKLQQRGATIQQKYICEKVFDLLKEAWNKFNSEER